jgi:glycosidase
MRRWSAWVSALVLVVTACSPGTTPTTTTETPTPTTTSSTAPDTPPAGPTAAPVRHPGAPRSIYFVMTDRFANGDPSNDTGGIDGGPLDHGYLPEDKGFYQGGDLVGLTERLPYLSGLGITAIWLTPPFVNRPVQGLGGIDNSSAGYHGYWQTDFTRIDPHLGTEEDMHRLIAAAKAAGIDIYFDVVVNHTGDVITYEEATFSYRSKNSHPYLDAQGTPFDDTDYAGSTEFPELDAAVSFPYTPTFATPEDATAKNPSWLNNPIYYHNRGNSTFTGESSLYGDFFGLDDLFTEHPVVVENLIALYSEIVGRYDVAGFRIDTVKHVNDEFWTQWTPSVLAAAADAGRNDFFMFGEVFATDPILNSHFVTNLGIPSLLDFILNEGLEQYVARGRPADALVQAFDRDDWFTGPNANASMLVTFFGNHDIGRMGRLIAAANPGARPIVLEEQMLLGFDLLFLSRGVPVVYYGDEQGFVGSGGDKSARQTMFPATATEFIDQPTIGSDATVSDDNFDPAHPFYRRVALLNTLRTEHPTLMTGAQIVHEPQGPIVSFSRVDRDERIEYIVIANNGAVSIPATVHALSTNTEFRQIHPVRSVVSSDSEGLVTVEVPARSAILLRAIEPLPFPDAPPTVRIARPTASQEIPTARYRIEAEVGDRRYAEVTFSISVDGGPAVILGTDDAPPFRLYWNNHTIAAGAEVEITVTVDDGSGRLASDSVTVVMGDRS